VVFVFVFSIDGIVSKDIRNYIYQLGFRLKTIICVFPDLIIVLL